MPAEHSYVPESKPFDIHSKEPFLFKRLRTLVILVPAILMTACATGVKYSDMKSRIPPVAADQGRIYFYRNSSPVGAAVQPSITLNGEVVGRSKPSGLFYVDRPPGNYEAACSTEVTRKVTFVLKAGQERYVKTSISMGFLVGHAIPELIDPEEGAQDIVTLHYAPAKAADKDTK